MTLTPFKNITYCDFLQFYNILNTCLGMECKGFFSVHIMLGIWNLPLVSFPLSFSHCNLEGNSWYPSLDWIWQCWCLFLILVHIVYTFWHCARYLLHHEIFWGGEGHEFLKKNMKTYSMYWGITIFSYFDVRVGEKWTNKWTMLTLELLHDWKFRSMTTTKLCFWWQNKN